MRTERTPRRAVMIAASVLLGAAQASLAAAPKITDLGGRAGYYTTARGINEAGEVVGEQYRTIDPSTDTRESFGLLWRKNALGEYFSTQIGSLPAFPNSYPRSINDAGQIGGWAEAASLVTGSPAQAVRWQRDDTGAYLPVDLGTPNGLWYSQTANFSQGGRVLNAQGQLAGSGLPPPCCSYLHAYLWTDPDKPPIDLSAAAATSDCQAYGVNNAGLVVGDAVRNTPEGWLQLAVLWQPDGAGGYLQTELRTPAGSLRATANDINDGGRIVGFADSRAIVWERDASGAYEPSFLEALPGGTYSRALAVNNAGDVVGWTVSAGSSGTFRHATLWQADAEGRLVPRDLGSLAGLGASDAYGINDRGQIVGSASYFDPVANTNVQHAVVWETGADTTPPVIAGASADPGVLWPPNHELVEVTVAYDATDDSGTVSCSLGPISSNERATPSDWEVLDPHHLRLRSERDEYGSGRVYAIPIACVDPSGNLTRQAVTVTVPHDQGR